MTRKALVIGIDDYPAKPLKGCANDAKAIAPLLERHFHEHEAEADPNFEVRTIISPGLDASRATIRAGLTTLFAGKSEIALLYFAGHGFYNKVGGSLVTRDAQRYDEGISMAEVLTLATQSEAKEVVILLDCCHSGAFGDMPAAGNLQAPLREGMSIMTACRTDELAVERGGHGLFTSLLLGGLSGGAADVLGEIDVGNLYAYVEQGMGAWGQRPLFKAHLSELVPLRKAKPEIARSVLRRLPELFERPDADLPLDPSYEPDAEPHDAKHEADFADLQKLRGVRLVVPVGEEHMYYAAMNSKACRLTPLGRQYWQLAKENRH